VRTVIQRVTSAEVAVDGSVVGRIGPGLLVLLGVERGDGPTDLEYTVAKVRDLRCFSDAEGRMNQSVQEVGGGVLVVSQFTLCGDTRKGRRPSFDDAAPPGEARQLYEDAVQRLRAAGLTVATGQFQAMMAVSLVNDGPVTFIVDSRKRL
jgi:D-tyrosyl-tRNA(Tyr) deacylase